MSSVNVAPCERGPCAGDRPAGSPHRDNLDPDETTTVKWRATFDGKKAKGTIDLDPVLSFTATRQD
jgi:hypothetical protein